MTTAGLVSSDAPRRPRVAAPEVAHGRTSVPATQPSTHAPSLPSADVFKTQPWLAPPMAGSVGHLRPGSQPAVLPSSVLIADKLNNRLIVVDAQGRVRWQFPNPGDLAPGQTFRVPDDAFFSPDGRYIVATQEDDSVISVVDVATHRIVYRYGVPGRPGMTANRVSNPDDAMLLAGGTILSADIKNCRLLLITMGNHWPKRVIGTTTNACLHHPPARWGSPNGAFPMADGHYLVTEINGDWVDQIDLTGRVYWSTHPPQVAYPSDTNQIGTDRYLTVDYAQPGQVVIFNRAGRSLWRFQGRGADVLNHPSLALALPNGDIILNDDFNHRVVVIDPRTNRIVWQYGHTRAAGRGSGYLNNPDGIDLVPPHSLLMTLSSSRAAPSSARSGLVRAV
ncbi:MAG TPA: PQQ-binding-like beta-propeller repeat protein [Jatrophihabitans sp.]|nr:PQQ-binding-like beta-propeller repeat protein [Jatrophihabitans sp.]